MSRLARDPASATAFLAATVAFGAAGYGLLFHASADDATTDKVATAVGANSVFGVNDPVGGRRPRRRRRRVDRGAAHGPAGSTASPATGCYAVDTATFAEAAHWSPRFAGRELSDLTRELARRAGPRRGAGGPRRQRRRTSRDRAPSPAATTFEVPYRVVDRIAGFAGSGPSQTVLVVDQDALLALAPPGAIDTLEAELWSARDADTVDPRGPRRRARAVSSRAPPTRCAPSTPRWWPGRG